MTQHSKKHLLKKAAMAARARIESLSAAVLALVLCAFESLRLPSDRLGNSLSITSKKISSTICIYFKQKVAYLNSNPTWITLRRWDDKAYEHVCLNFNSFSIRLQKIHGKIPGNLKTSLAYFVSQTKKMFSERSLVTMGLLLCVAMLTNTISPGHSSTPQASASEQTCCGSEDITAGNILDFGNPEADTQIVIYFDLDCRGRYLAAELPALIERYGEHIHMVLKNNPSGETEDKILFNQRLRAALWMLASAEQDKFWEAYNYLSLNDSRLEALTNQIFADELTLDLDQLNETLANVGIKATLERNRSEAAALSPNNSTFIVVNDTVVQGMPNITDLESIILSQLLEQGKIAPNLYTDFLISQSTHLSQ